MLVGLYNSLMQKEKIQEIGKYIENLEIELSEENFDSVALQIETSKLQQTIKLLKDETFNTNDNKLKSLLAYFEMKLRKCLRVVEMELGVRN